MNKYTVKVKQVYVYEGIEAKNKDEAMDKIMRLEWFVYDGDQALEVSAKKEDR